MTDQCLDRRHSHVTVDFFVHGLVLEVVLNLVLHLLLESLFLGSHVTCLRLVVILVLHLLLAQIPEMDLAIVIASGQLVDIGQVLEALDEVVDEPRCVLGPVSDVLFAQLVTSHLLLAAGGALHGPVLIGLVIGITGLGLVVEREEQFDVPSEDSTLCAT